MTNLFNEHSANNDLTWLIPGNWAMDVALTTL